MSSTGSPPKKRKNNHHHNAPAVIEIIDLIDDDDDNKKPAASAHRNNHAAVIDLVTESNTSTVSSKVAVAVLDLTAPATTNNNSTNNNTEYNIVVEMQRVWTTTPRGGAPTTTTHSSSAMHRDDDTGGDNTGDEAFARKLQAEDDFISQIASPRQEQRRMMETIPGRAVLFVERIIRLVDEMNTTNTNSNSTHQNQHTVEPVTKDDMVYFAERLLRKQEEFQLNGIPFQVCIGYHYTNDANMQKIRENGLMTRQERATNQVVSSNTHGSVFGDGIYTANNPTAFSNYGTAGLILARILGKTIRVPRSLSGYYTTDARVKEANTIIGDKNATSSSAWPATDSYHELVLKDSAQCLPMIKYTKRDMHTYADRRSGGRRENWSIIQKLTVSLQKVIDEVFNKDATPPSLATATASVVDPVVSNPIYTTASSTSTTSTSVSYTQSRHRVSGGVAYPPMSAVAPQNPIFGTTASSNMFAAFPSMPSKAP